MEMCQDGEVTTPRGFEPCNCLSWCTVQSVCFHTRTKTISTENKTALNIVIFSFLFFLAEKFCTIHALNENGHEDNKTLL
jgi:hypothetical protein